MPTPVRYSPAVETPAEDEAEISAGINAALREILETTARDYGHAVRSVHAKSHGIFEGVLTLADHLPRELAQGIAARPGAHPVIMRLSTNPGDILPDDITVPRGVALRIFEVDGEMLPSAEGLPAQDFIMVNGPAFNAKDTKPFLASLKLLAKTTDRMERSKKLISAMFRGAETVLEAVGLESATLKALGGQPATHPLGDSFFTQTAYRYGDYIAKLSLAPVSPQLLDLHDKKIDIGDRPDALREEIDAVIAAKGGEWELRVQLCTDLDKMPVEDASVEWDQAQSPFRAIGRVVVPPQPGRSAEMARRVDDGMGFSPWQGLAAHQPLGVVNRARRSAYPMSAAFRAAFNGCPVMGQTRG
ncbi:catalase family protein [Sphingoaurantiacus capsulatus]|uniref:Catalase family protein n=1 Tax=Sphingoaurantiacus capsulatus TaxID=1771310 RepID=A0ABV7X6Z2_9SPHN